MHPLTEHLNMMHGHLSLSLSLSYAINGILYIGFNVRLTILLHHHLTLRHSKVVLLLMLLSVERLSLFLPARLVLVFQLLTSDT